MEIKDSAIKKILRETGELLLRYYGNSELLSKKGNRDILHKADIESEHYIISQLNALYPKIPVLSEERGFTTGSQSQYRFVLDPLDGTINFSRKIPEFGTSLAMQKNRQTMYGIVYKPSLNLWYEARKDKGAFLNGYKLKVSMVEKLDEAVIAIDPAREDSVFPMSCNILHPKIRAYRSFGCAIQTLGLIAEGKIDAYIFDRPKIWDIAAMQLIIEEAGGVVLDQKGNPWKEEQPLLITTKSLQNELVNLLK